MKRWALLLILFITCFGHSQEIYRVGLLPSVNLNSSLGSKIKLNFKTESRINLYHSIEKESIWELTDASLIGASKIGSNSNMAFGYLIRIRSGALVHRSIQQFTYVHQYPIKIAHRIMLDQSFANGQFPLYRMRYRIGTEIPLSGKTLNSKELYFKFSNEYIFLLQNRTTDLHIRFSPYIGYSFTQHNKVEIGLNQRLERLFSANSQIVSWIGLNWYYSF